MKKEIKDSPYIGKKIAHFDENGDIIVDHNGEKRYIIEKVYEMGTENIQYICFLTVLEAFRSHGQIEWEVTGGDSDTVEYKFWKKHIDKNRKEYKWV